MSEWPSTRARHVLTALLRVGWQIRRESGGFEMWGSGFRCLVIDAAMGSHPIFFSQSLTSASRIVHGDMVTLEGYLAALRARILDRF